MNNALIYLLAFVAALGILIAVHEYGHFWVARRLGVKVLRFSIGFGAPLWRRRSRNGETEYVLAAIPLGGYVKMLDEREGPVPEDQRHRAFNNKPIGTRMAVVSAGPAFNFLFAIAAFWLLSLLGVPGLAPVLGHVEPDSMAARAGLQVEERITSVNGEQTPTWEAARLALFHAALDGEPARLEVETAQGGSAARTLDFSERTRPVEPQGLLREIGIEAWGPPPVVSAVRQGGAADRAGLRPGDRVLALDGEPIRYWHEWVVYVRERAGQDIQVTVQRSGETHTVTLRPEEQREGDQVYGFVGVERAPVPEGMVSVRRYGPLEGLGQGFAKTWDMSVLMLRVLGSMLMGEAALSNISGPLTIAQFAGETAALGVTPFINFLAVVSVSLGVLNLLPIPILDGGHLMYYLIELAKGSPVSEQAQQIGQRVGILLLLMLMALAFYNDFMRLFY